MSSSGTLAPLRHRSFAFMLVGSLFSHLGNAIQAAGAAWQLTASGQPADIVALVQSATNLPIMLLALPAGAWADMHDRRLLMLGAQLFMISMSFILIILAFLGYTNPFLLIGITALLASGVALFNPALAASIGGMVPRTDLAAAVSLNILAFNLGRCLGPAIGGAIVAAGGARTAFIVNACSYLVVVLLMLRWRADAAPPGERRRLHQVIGEGFRFVVASPSVRVIILRAVTFTLTGSAAWALMPLVSTQLLGRGSVTFGLLLGALGLGAVFGAASSTWFRQRFGSEAIVRTSGMTYGLACLLVGFGPRIEIMLILLVVGGATWVQALSGFSVAGQMWSPRPLVGRVTAMVSSVTFGGIALGSWFWGHVAQGHGVGRALMLSGGAMLILPVLGLILPMPRHDGLARS